MVLFKIREERFGKSIGKIEIKNEIYGNFSIVINIDNEVYRVFIIDQVLWEEFDMY